jgi:hypothetical protein
MPEKRIHHVALISFAFCVFITFVNCKGADKILQDKASIDSMVSKKLGKKYDLSYNGSKTYALCQQQREGDHQQRSFKYIVVRLSDNYVVREGSFRMGYVKWQGDQSIEVSSSVSVRDEQGQKQIINIHSNQQ